MKLLMHRINRTDQNVHIQRNIEMFRKLGIEVRDVYNGELLRGDLSGADAICLNCPCSSICTTASRTIRAIRS